MDEWTAYKVAGECLRPMKSGELHQQQQVADKIVSALMYFCKPEWRNDMKKKKQEHGGMKKRQFENKWVFFKPYGGIAADEAGPFRKIEISVQPESDVVAAKLATEHGDLYRIAFNDGFKHGVEFAKRGECD